MTEEECVQQILEESALKGADKLRIAASYAFRVVSAASDRAMGLKQISSKVVVWGDALRQWKSVVNQVHRVEPTHPIFVNLFGAVVALCAPELFTILVKENVFLGYELSKEEKAVISQNRLEYMIA